MNDTTSCPSCSRLLRVPETLLGHDVKCPSCGNTFATSVQETAPVPAPASAPVEETLEEADDRPSGKKDSSREANRSPKRFRRTEDEEDEDEEDRPRRSRKSRDEDEEDEDEEDRRPRRARRNEEEEEDEDDRPRRRRYQPHRGELILVLGILSIFFAHMILGPIAWFMGSSDLAAMDAGRMDPAGRSSTQAGRTIGMVITILSLVVVVGACLIGGVLFLMIGVAGSVR
jgi:hypothetical protein